MNLKAYVLPTTPQRPTWLCVLLGRLNWTTLFYLSRDLMVLMFVTRCSCTSCVPKGSKAHDRWFHLANNSYSNYEVPPQYVSGVAWLFQLSFQHGGFVHFNHLNNIQYWSIFNWSLTVNMQNSFSDILLIFSYLSCPLVQIQIVCRFWLQSCFSLSYSII